MATMNNRFFEKPILNTPYSFPTRHWELDEQGQPAQRIIESRRRAEFITPIPKPKKRNGSAEQKSLLFDEGKGLSTQEQRYAHTAIINSVRQQVDRWRALPNTNDWRVTTETARLLQHWRHHKFSSIRPFFCQIEAVETAIWLTEVAPPQPPRETVQVKAVRPERDALETRFPRMEGYRVELPADRITADFNDDSVLVLTTASRDGVTEVLKME